MASNAKDKKPPKKKAGRPAKVLTEQELKQIELLSGMFCSWSEISEMINCPVSTLENKQEAKEAHARGVAKGKCSLRRYQFKAAEKLNPTMLVWLGRIHLGQKETRDIVIDTDGPAHVTIAAYAE